MCFVSNCEHYRFEFKSLKISPQTDWCQRVAMLHTKYMRFECQPYRHNSKEIRGKYCQSSMLRFDIRLNAFVASRFIGYNNKHLLIASAYILWLKACNYKRCGDFGHLNSNRFNGQSCFYVYTTEFWSLFFLQKNISHSHKIHSHGKNVAKCSVHLHFNKFIKNGIFTKCSIQSVVMT